MVLLLFPVSSWFVFLREEEKEQNLGRWDGRIWEELEWENHDQSIF